MSRPDGLRRDRDGDLVPDDEPAPTRAPACPPSCRRGWLGADAEERPIPCPSCRPGLAAPRPAPEPAAPPPPELQRLIDASRLARQRTTPTHRPTPGGPHDR